MLNYLAAHEVAHLVEDEPLTAILAAWCNASARVTSARKRGLMSMAADQHRYGLPEADGDPN